MIDFEKLKIATEICKKSLDYYFRVDFCVRNNSDKLDIYLMSGDEIEESFDSLDELIAKLNELTQPEPKYKKSQLVWFLDDIYRIRSRVVRDSWIAEDIDTGEKEYAYDVSMQHPMCESNLFPTRQSLIEHQLQYWQSMSMTQMSLSESGSLIREDSKPDIQSNQPQVDVDRCQHEWDGVLKSKNPNLGNCKKCGEECYVALTQCQHEPKPTHGEQFEYQTCVKCGEHYR